MKKMLISFIAILFFSAFQFSDDRKIFKKLDVLEGIWIMNSGKRIIGEEWKKTDAELLQCKGFYVKGKDTVITENVDLKITEKGIFYIPVVEDQNNREPVSFKLTSAENDSYVFENPQHDFPKRITYQFVSADSLHAFIDGGPASPGERQDFYFKKIR